MEKLLFQTIASDFCISSEAEPIIRLYGRTRSGLSVCCKVHGYFPYIHVKVPDWFTEEDCKLLLNYLNEKLHISPDEFISVTPMAIKTIELVTKRSIFHPNHPLFQGGTESFAKITYMMPSVVHTLKALLLNGVALRPNKKTIKLSAYEPHVDFVTSFFNDNDLDGCGWVKVIYDKIAMNEGCSHTESRCNLEVDTSIENIHKCATSDFSTVPAPFKIISLDIECLNRDCTFPNPEVDPIIQISNILFKFDENMTLLAKQIFVLGSCAPIVDCSVSSFDSESLLLVEWQEFIVDNDPDIILGYNHNNFDLWYILERSRLLGISNPVAFLGRIKHLQSKVVKNEYYQELMKRFQDRVKFNLEGRVIFDLYLYLRNNYNLPSYKLNSVSKHFLGEEKLDIHHSQIKSLHEGDMFSRRKLAEYCLRDSVLPILLLKNLNIMYKCMHLANATGVCLQRLVFDGIELKILSLLIRKVRTLNSLLPIIPNNLTFTKCLNYSQMKCSIFAHGSTYFQRPIVVLKVPLLYESVITAANICFSTVYEKLYIDNGFKRLCYDFVKPDCHAGVLPSIFKTFFDELFFVRILLQGKLDTHLSIILNERVEALRDCANDILRFFSGHNGVLSCSSIGANIVSISTTVLKSAIHLIENHFADSKKIKRKAKVVFANEKLLMIDFGEVEISEAFELGKQAAEIANEGLESPVKVELGFVYSPLLIMNKCQYAGCVHEMKNTLQKTLKVEGISTAFPCLCKLVEKTFKQTLVLLCEKGDVSGALDFVQTVVNNLFLNQITMIDLAITQKLSIKDTDDHTPLARLVRRQKARNELNNNVPRVGFEVLYVVVENQENNKDIYLETPVYAIVNNLKINVEFYLTQLKDPINMLFFPVIGKNLLD